MRKQLTILSIFIWCAVAAHAQGLPRHYTRFIKLGEWVKLTATASNATAYQWFLNGQPIPGATQQQYVTAQPGTYTVQVANNGACAPVLSDPVTISVIKEDVATANQADLEILKRADTKPVVVNSSFNYYLTAKNNGPANAAAVVVTDQLPKSLKVESVMPPAVGEAGYDPAAHKIVWNIPSLRVEESAELTIVAKATTAGTVENIATITARQPDSIQTNNKATNRKEILGIHIPNVITPNSDGFNDQFVIKGLEQYEANELIILNRWGNHVFEQKSYSQNWEGRGLSEGTYFYLLKIKDKAGQWQELKGYLTLLKPK